MADNVELDAGSGGDKIAADDDGTAKHQQVKVEFGADGTQTKVTTTEGLPVQNDDTDLKVSLDGEAVVLGAGTAAYGKLSANSGVDIGDVDVTSVIPGTAATSLGKAIDTAAGSTDTGVAALFKHVEDQVHLTTADGDYEVGIVDSLGAQHVNPESHHDFDPFDATTDWTVLGNDTINLVTTTKHALGTKALKFDKTDGLANTVFGGIANTITSVDLGDVSPHDIIQGILYLPSLSLVDYCFIRIGTNVTNYNEWQIPADALTAATFEIFALPIGDVDHDGITGNGWDPSAITYIAVGVAMVGEGDALAGIIFDHLSYHSSQHSSTTFGAEVSADITAPNVKVQKWRNTNVSLNAGNTDGGTLRVTVATDDANLAAIKTATEAGTAILDSGTALTPKYVKISAASSGNNTILAAVSGKKIRVLSYVMISAGTVLAAFEDGADAGGGNSELTGRMSLVANSGVAPPAPPWGHFEGSSNVLLNLELSAAIQVSGHLTYVEV